MLRIDPIFKDRSLEISKASITTSCSHGEALGRVGQETQPWGGTKKLLGIHDANGKIYIYIIHTQHKKEAFFWKKNVKEVMEICEGVYVQVMEVWEKKDMFPFYTSNHHLYILYINFLCSRVVGWRVAGYVLVMHL